MKRRRYQPWKKGPAQIIAFPAVPLRAWWARQLPCGGWRGEIVGDGVEGSRITEIGSHFDLMRELKWPGNRRGLPIIVGECRISPFDERVTA